MNVKKGLIFSVAGVAMLTGLAAYAGGPEVINTAVAPTCAPVIMALRLSCTSAAALVGHILIGIVLS